MRTARLRPRIARLVADEPALEVHVREASRRLNASPSAVGVALKAMEKSGQLTSRWVGRSKVYSAAGTGVAGPVAALSGVGARERREMLARFPAAPAEWERRPYFLWDRDMSWREFREIAIDAGSPRSDWAVARLLDHARWGDIWHLISPADVRRVLPRVRVKYPDVWRDLVEADPAAG